MIFSAAAGLAARISASTSSVDGVADEQGVLLPVGHEICCDGEDIGRICDGADEGDLVAHDAEEVDGNGLLVDRDDAECGALLGGGNGGLDDRRNAGGIEVDVDISLSGEHCFPAPWDRDEPPREVLVSGVDDRISTDLQRLLATGAYDIGDDNVLHTK